MPAYLNISDCRQLNHCLHGVRRFCTRYELDFKKLLDGKMTIKEFEDTDQGMALEVVVVAKARIKFAAALKKKVAKRRKK